MCYLGTLECCCFWTEKINLTMNLETNLLWDLKIQCLLMFYCRSRIWGVNPKSCIFKDYLLKYVPLTSRTSYIKNAIRKTFCFLKMVYSIFDRISDALITTYLTQLLLINCVCVIRYFSKNQFESSILAKSKSFLFLYFDFSTPTSTQNCFFRNPKCSDSLQSIPMIVCISRYSFSSNWNRFKRFHSLCLCSEECLIKSFYINLIMDVIYWKSEPCYFLEPSLKIPL